MNKIIFLDIDGVLNSARSVIAFGGFPHNPDGYERGMFDEVAVQLIKGIAEQAEANIILSSSWRKHNNWQDIGPSLGLPIIGRTPSMSGFRGEEIEHWMKSTNQEISHYAIIDDDSDMLEHQMPHFVHTSGFDGFTWANAQKLCELMDIDIYDVNRHKCKEFAKQSNIRFFKERENGTRK